MVPIQVARIAINLIGMAVLLAARWAGLKRKQTLKFILEKPGIEKDKEIIFLKDRVKQLQSQVEIQLHKPDNTTRYTNLERFKIIFHLTYFDIPRRQIKKCLGVSRSTLYRWLKNMGEPRAARRQAWNRTATDVATLVWNVACSNAHWGVVRIANQLRILGVFLSPSTVRNILNRPSPPTTINEQSPETTTPEEPESRSIPAFHPNHVWSMDLTEVFCWGFRRVSIIVVIDHFSRKVVSVKPLANKSSNNIIAVLEESFRAKGPPKHLISDQECGFNSAEMAGFLKPFKVKQRFGAIGKHGSIAVTERVNRTLKEEWLHRVPLIRGIAHLKELCSSFKHWYNEWRPHMTLDGFRPADFYCRDQPEPVEQDAKVVPLNIERRSFRETRVTGFRLPKAA